MNAITIFSIGVHSEPRGNRHGYTASDYARDVADEINKRAGEQGRSTDREWFEREIESAKGCIGHDLLFITLEDIDLDDEE